MKTSIAFAILFGAAGMVTAVADQPPATVVQHRVVLQSPGGELPFVLEVKRSGDGVWGWIINGDERIDVDVAACDSSRIALRFDHFNASLEAQFDSAVGAYAGEWKKRIAKDKWSRLACRIEPAQERALRFKPAGNGASPSGKSVTGRWWVRFEKSDDPAVGVFEQDEHGAVTGTFLTTTGDYRFLAGDCDGRLLRLSSFDGAHAFLFTATIDVQSRLRGDFWSRDVWHERWTARRDENATLPDAMAQTRSVGKIEWEKLKFPDRDGNKRTLNEPQFAGKARIVEIFGSWCPNCHDASRYLEQLHQRYKDRGLSIVGLAFEVTGDLQSDATQVRRYARRCGVTYPLLIAGVNDRTEASRTIDWVDEIRAYPTTIFADAEGNVRAVYTGFSGPATGDEYKKLQAEFEALIESMLDPPGE